MGISWESSYIEVRYSVNVHMYYSVADIIRLYHFHNGGHTSNTFLIFLAEKDPVLLNVYSACLGSHPELMAGSYREWLERYTPR